MRRKTAAAAKRTNYLGFALASTLALLGACQRASAPLPIAFGSQSCSHCGQVIAEPRFSAQFRSSDGTPKAFDDAGCLFAALRADPAASDVYFHDYTGGDWIAAGDVYLVRAAGVDTPQHHGWVAYRSFTAAQDAVTTAAGGEVVRFAEGREKIP